MCGGWGRRIRMGRNLNARRCQFLNNYGVCCRTDNSSVRNAIARSRAEREGILVECNMTGSDHSSCIEIEATITAVVSGIPQQHASSGTGSKLMRHGGCLIRKAKTAEDSEVVIARWGAEQTLEWRGGTSSLARTPIKKMRCCG